ncbi:hypothetical protein SANA_25110 [Gottschalkiaceae bacterium SANA]|nr:hypothetical protein SANA_25110 [Gottschalkiaceae bacterium SANA]
MIEELRDILCKQLRIVNEYDLSDPLVQDDLIQLNEKMKQKIINGR